MPTRRPHLTQANLDWLIGSPAKKTFQVRELCKVLGVERDSVIALFDSGELWGHEHARMRGAGINTKRIATRDSVLVYLAKTATYDDALKAQRLAEALSTVRDPEMLLQLRTHLNRLLAQSA